jgi:hypothetical protein
MDYSRYTEFPFPSVLSPEEEKVKSFFLSLDDGEQLRLLSGCVSYRDFYGRVVCRMDKRTAAAW